METISFCGVCEKISSENLKSIVETSLKLDCNAYKTHYQGIISNKFPGFSHFQKIPLNMLKKQVLQDCVAESAVAKILLESWYKSVESLHEITKNKLTSYGYKVIEPDFKSDHFNYNLLLKKHTKFIEDRIYVDFGDKVESELVLFNETLLSFLFGWFPNNEEGEEDEILHHIKELDSSLKEKALQLREYLNDLEKKIIPNSIKSISFDEQLNKYKYLYNELSNSELDLTDITSYCIDTLYTKYHERKNNDNIVKDSIEHVIHSILGLKSQESEINNKLKKIIADFKNSYSHLYKNEKFDELKELLKEDNRYSALINLIEETINSEKQPSEKLYNIIHKEFGSSITFNVITGKITIDKEEIKELDEPVIVSNKILMNKTKTNNQTETDDTRVSLATENVVTKKNEIDSRQTPISSKENLDSSINENEKPIKEGIKAKTKSIRLAEQTPISSKEKSDSSKDENEKPIREGNKTKSIRLADTDKDQNIIKPDSDFEESSLENVFKEDCKVYEKIFEYYNSEMRSAANILNFYINIKRFADVKKLPNWLIESTVLSIHLTESDGEIFDRLQGLYKHYNLSKLEFSKYPLFNDAINLMLFSSSLIPALRSPGTGAATILSNLRFYDNGLQAIYKLSSKISEFSSTIAVPLDKGYLQIFQDSYDIEKHKVKLVNEVNEWFVRSKNKKISFIPAKKVLHFLFNKGELIYNFIDPILNSDITSKHYKINDQSDEYFEKEIKLINRRINPRHDKITGTALNTILAKIREARSFANKWKELNKKGSETTYTFVIKEAQALRNLFNQSHAQINLELEKFGSYNHIYCKAMSKLALVNINVLNEIFNPRVNTDDTEDSIHVYLEEDLALFSTKLWYEVLNEIYNENTNNANFELFIDLLRKNNETSAKIVDELLQLPQQIDFQNLFNTHCIEGNHILTEKLMSRLISQKDISLSSLEEKRNASINEHRGRLIKKIEMTKGIIEKGLTEDLISESRRNDYLSQIKIFESQNIFNFGFCYSKLDEIEKEIIQLKLDKKKKIFERIKENNIKGESLDKFKDLLNNDKLATAQTYLETLENGESIFDLPDEGSRLNDFLESIGKINKFLGSYDKKLVSFIANLRELTKNKKLGPISLPKNQPQKRKIENVLSSWFKIKFDEHVKNSENLTNILSWLGFTVIEESLTKETNDRNNRIDHEWFDFKTTDIITSPIPSFGTAAKKNYHLLCVFKGESILNVLDFIKRKNITQNIIVFNFWRIDEKGRRILSKSCFNERISTIFIDDILLLYLASLKEKEITKSLFQLTLPFSFSTPYITAAGQVPKEMFYGRKKEIESLLNPHGSCIIYGGRQLGKTAILKKIEAEYHSPESGLYIVFIDLKAKGFGVSNQNPDYIWQIIASELKKNAIISNKRCSNFSQFERYIKDWLENNSGSRLLILLDEADKFIEIDANQQLTRLASLRGLMDETESKFKFVLSGLHNVQKFTKISNSTMSHLLTRGSYCIGPLIGNGEQFEAVKLIVEPFRAMGYEFENEEIVYKILHHTNYYPSLIQLFCDNLMHEIIEQISAKFDINNYPPFKITNDDIELVYSKKRKLRKDIIDRFQWTLNLDPRYELIAYLIAYLCNENNEYYKSGLSVNEIILQSKKWKKELFESDNQYEDIKDILDEMIGLGILRRTNENKFSLKDSNIYRLLGSNDEIETNLISIDDRPSSIDLEMDTYRRKNPKANHELSPFTARQEKVILSLENSVIIVSGNGALGIDKTSDFIQYSLYEIPITSNLTIVTKINSFNLFQRKFEEFINAAEYDMEILIISYEAMWDESWIKYAYDRMKRKRGKNHIKKAIFLADDTMIWSFLNGDRSYYEDIIKQGIQEIRLRKISTPMINNWKQEAMVSEVDEVMKNTDRWLGLHHRYLKLTERNKVKLLLNLDDKKNFEENLDELKSLFGLKNENILNLLSKMVEFDEEIGIEELQEWCENTLSFSQIEHILDWCSFFSLVTENSKNKYFADPIVSKIVSKINEK